MKHAPGDRIDAPDNCQPKTYNLELTTYNLELRTDRCLGMGAFVRIVIEEG